MTDDRPMAAAAGAFRADERIADESLAEQVARRLSQAILAGDYGPGVRLPEPEIAARFGVSRGPVREAFHMLAREGLVQFRPRRGVVVPELTPQEARELYEVRAVLFALACRLAAQRVSPETLAAARATLGRMATSLQDGAPAAEFMGLRTELATIICSAAGNRTLIEEMERMNRRALLHFAVFDREERRRESLALWTRVVEALESRDQRKAAAAAFSMVEASGREVLRLLAERMHVAS